MFQSIAPAEHRIAHVPGQCVDTANGQVSSSNSRIVQGALAAARRTVHGVGRCWPLDAVSLQVPVGRAYVRLLFWPVPQAALLEVQMIAVQVL